MDHRNAATMTVQELNRIMPRGHCPTAIELEPDELWVCFAHEDVVPVRTCSEIAELKIVIVVAVLESRPARGSSHPIDSLGHTFEVVDIEIIWPLTFSRGRIDD